MIINNEEKPIRDLFKDAKNIAIFVPETLGKDAVAAACAIYDIAMQEEKSAKILYKGTIDVANTFKPFAKIENTFDEAELIISFDYKNTPIERVGYSTDDGVFSMKISPVEKNFDLSKIGYQFTGPRFDLIVTIGAKELAELGDFYLSNEDVFKNAAILNLDVSPENKLFGVMNVVIPAAVSYTGLVFSRLGVWGYIPSEKAVEAMLLGIKKD